MKSLVKDFVMVLVVSLAISLVATIIYISTPNFYLNTFNIAIVPNLEKSDTNFNYNGFYQGETSKNIVTGAQLFAATNDFKKTLQSQVDENIYYLLSKTHGNNIVAIQIVTISPMDIKKVTPVILQNIQSSLDQTVPKELSYSVKSMDNFNHTVKAGIGNLKFFVIVFGTSLIFVSVIYLLKSYYKEK